jgi:hypothetical protein
MSDTQKPPVPANIGGDRMILSEMSGAFQERYGIAQAVSLSRMFKGVDTPQKALTLMLLAEAEGIHFMQAFMRYHVIDGQPTKKTDTVLAEYQSNKGVMQWLERSKTRAAAMFKSSLVPDGIEVEFTEADARAYGLWGKQNWTKDPANMLAKRCISRAIRLVMPGIMVGMMTTEEALDTLPVDPEPEPQGTRDLSAARAAIAATPATEPATEPKVEGIPYEPKPQVAPPVAKPKKAKPAPERKPKMSAEFLKDFWSAACDEAGVPTVDEAKVVMAKVITRMVAALKLPTGTVDYLDLDDTQAVAVLAAMGGKEQA